MKRLAFGLFGLLLILPMAVSCGSASMAPPPYLEVQAFLPEDGATSVGLGVVPTVRFIGEVDDSSVTSESFYLQSTSREYLTLECQPDNRKACDCDPWTVDVEGDHDVDGITLTFLPDPPLDANKCYRLTLTTAIRGVELGPLEDMRWPVECRQNVGAQAIFCTPE